MRKLQILLVDNCENQIEFFTDALSESGLGFICNTARNIEQACKILNNSMPDAVFIDASMIGAKRIAKLKEAKPVQSSFIFYTTVNGIKPKQTAMEVNYVQLPESIQTMANILKNFFIDYKENSTHAKDGIANFAE